jgi:hypothetical protein
MRGLALESQRKINSVDAAINKSIATIHPNLKGGCSNELPSGTTKSTLTNEAVKFVCGKLIQGKFKA